MKIDNKIYFAPGVEFKDVNWDDHHTLVEFFRQRVLAYYISPAQSMSELARAREDDAYSLLGIAFGSGLICCTTIDFLASIEFYEPKVGDRYRKWLKNYIPNMCDADPDNSPSVIAHRFYDEFRNGLVHNGRIKNAGQFSLDVDTFDTHEQIFTFVEHAMVVHPFNLLHAVESCLYQYCDTLHAVPADLTDFADVVMMPEMTPDGSGFRVNTRLARFSNIPELSAMLSQFMILRRFKDVNGQVDRPNLYCDRPTAVKIPGSRQLKEFVKILAKRAEEIRGGQVDPRTDNMLKVVGDGRKAALDLRLAIPGIEEIALSKINIAAQNIAAIYQRSRERKSAQIVFCDLGTPKPERVKYVLMKNSADDPIICKECGHADVQMYVVPSNDVLCPECCQRQEESEKQSAPRFRNVYADLKAKLVKLGVHPSEIAFIHDANGPAERSQMFAAVREGRIRVLIGSTEKMGTGMNAQTRAIAMHHLDAPWRPADLEQREGRLIRQGNMYPEVFSFVYIVEGSFDGYSWQILETKAKFIEQFMTGQTDVREMDDIGETVLSMAEIKALASGNPKIMERVMAQNEIMKLEQLRLSWQNERRNSQRQLASRKEELEQTNIRIRNLGIGAQMRDSHTADQFTMKVDGKEHTERKVAGQQLIEMARAVKLDAERAGKEARKAAGSYRGFVMWLRAKPHSERSMSDLVQDPNGGVDIILDYNVPQVLVAHVSDSDTGTIASVDAAIRSIDGEIKKSTERKEFLVREIETLETLLKDPWEKAEKLEALVARLTELDQELIKAGIDLRKDEAKEQDDNSVEEIVVEEEAVPEPEQILEFDIQAILQRIDDIHATMTLPVYAEEELIAIPTGVPNAIPVTEESVAQLERQAESSALMAGFTRSILSGTGQMSIDDFLEMPVKQTILKKGLTKAQKKVVEGQLTLF